MNHKIKVIIARDEIEELKLWEVWLRKNQSLIKILKSEGCGCCVDIFELEGAQEILNTIPEKFRAG